MMNPMLEIATNSGTKISHVFVELKTTLVQNNTAPPMRSRHTPKRSSVRAPTRPSRRVVIIAAVTIPVAFTANTIENCDGLSPRTF
ncbi:Uncharacterised protein [Mycobacteroides abscessus subsp. abscessus]|nr:Uncharacterised protein [Mycobacteroides abscessus subsp. abscessus]